MIEILHACPANCATGGPEAIHSFVRDLNKCADVYARVLYWDVHDYSDPCPDEYKPYGCEHVFDIPAGFDGVLIVPEIWANEVLNYDCHRAIYWLGVDAYAGWTDVSERGAFLADPNILHIVQSEYAFDTLRKLGVIRIVKRTDTVNADFYGPHTEEPRNNVVLYNPAKATPFMRRLIASMPDIKFRPVTGMTRTQVIDTMRHAKLYVDFGEFPGRERMPREAALCGCCLVTSKTGAAGYPEDFDHPYKFESKDSHIWVISTVMRRMLEHYDAYRNHFAPLREQLIEDVTRVSDQTKEVVNEIQHYHSRA